MHYLLKFLFLDAGLNLGVISTPSTMSTTTQLIERNKWDLKTLLHFVSPIPFSKFQGS